MGAALRRRVSKCALNENKRMQKPSIYARARQLASSGRYRGFTDFECILKDEYSGDALAILRSDLAFHRQLRLQCDTAFDRENPRRMRQVS